MNKTLLRNSKRFFKTGIKSTIALPTTTVYIIVKKLFSLNSRVMDDNHDTYKTANIKIHQVFLNA
jgi:hypothetical protein